MVNAISSCTNKAALNHAGLAQPCIVCVHALKFSLPSSWCGTAESLPYLVNHHFSNFFLFCPELREGIDDDTKDDVEKDESDQDDIGN